jgi:benzoate/toluate 1,2-dioxygenase subunit beta
MLNTEAVQAFLFQEARAQADKRWDDWLACYAEDATFHMPAWDDDAELTSDPQNEVSLIYYANRQGLEDRVFRIGTERSSATIPDTRWNRSISNVEILKQDEGSVEVAFNWTTHSYRYKHTDVYFGTARCTLDTRGSKPLIKRKVVVLKNDYIHHVLDVYQV